jgi:hypothetical protein
LSDPVDGDPRPWYPAELLKARVTLGTVDPVWDSISNNSGDTPEGFNGWATKRGNISKISIDRKHERSYYLLYLF